MSSLFSAENNNSTNEGMCGHDSAERLLDNYCLSQLPNNIYYDLFRMLPWSPQLSILKCTSRKLQEHVLLYNAQKHSSPCFLISLFIARPPYYGFQIQNGVRMSYSACQMPPVARILYPWSTWKVYVECPIIRDDSVLDRDDLFKIWNDMSEFIKTSVD